MDQEFHRVTVRGLTLDPATNAPIVILRTDDGGRFLPIWIGLFEANAIAMEMEGVTAPRPMTHDLLRDLARALGAEVTQAVVDNLRENTFHATVYLRSGAAECRLDARPSDAIALALRAGAPIFVTGDVLARARVVELDEGLGEPEQWRAWLDRIRPGDFEHGGGADREG
jgi:bifunctional DNase/RNase